MPDAWDDSGDEWDADSDDDQIASRLANLNTGPAKKVQVEEEEDLAVIEKALDVRSLGRFIIFLIFCEQQNQYVFIFFAFCIDPSLKRPSQSQMGFGNF